MKRFDCLKILASIVDENTIVIANVGPISREREMRMALHQAGHDQPPVGVDLLTAAHQPDFLAQRASRADPHDAASTGGDRSIRRDRWNR